MSFDDDVVVFPAPITSNILVTCTDPQPLTAVQTYIPESFGLALRMTRCRLYSGIPRFVSNRMLPLFQNIMGRGFASTGQSSFTISPWNATIHRGCSLAIRGFPEKPKTSNRYLIVLTKEETAMAECFIVLPMFFISTTVYSCI